MQTLTAGSFLNLENASTVEALKFTAARLAEHTASVVAGKMNIPSLANLASNLWEKAEYVARDTERRRLRQIFIENFIEKFCELKPDARAGSLASEILPNSLSAENGESKQTPDMEIAGRDENINAARENVSSPGGQSETDEFLGFVKSDEPFQDSSGAQFETPDTAEKLPPPEVQNQIDTQQVAATKTAERTEFEPPAAPASVEIAAEKSNSENRPAESESKLPEAKNGDAAKPQTAVTAKKESGEQSARAKVAEADKVETIAASKNTAASSAQASSVQSVVGKQSGAANDAQPSLF